VRSGVINALITTQAISRLVEKKRPWLSKIAHKHFIERKSVHFLVGMKP